MISQLRCNYWNGCLESEREQLKNRPVFYWLLLWVLSLFITKQAKSSFFTLSTFECFKGPSFTLDIIQQIMWRLSKKKFNMFDTFRKQSAYSPVTAHRIPWVWASQISRQSVLESGKVVIPTYKPPLTPGYISGTLFCRRLSRFQGYTAVGRIMSKKNSNNTIGIRPATFQYVKQCLNQLSLRVQEKQIFKNKFIQFCQSSKFSRWKLTIMIATARRYLTQHAACWNRLLATDHGIRSDPSICFAVASWVLPCKDIKINKRNYNYYE